MSEPASATHEESPADHRDVRRPRGSRIRIWHVALWLVGLALVLVYSRGSRNQPGVIAGLLVSYALATMFGMWTSRVLQRTLLVLIALLPLVAEGVLVTTGVLGRPAWQSFLTTALVIGTLVVGVPSWLALFVTLVIRGVEQPRERRVRILSGVLLLLGSWLLAVVLLFTFVAPFVWFTD